MSNEIKGFVAKGFEPVLDKFAENFANGLENGATICVQQDGETIVNLWGGYRDRAKIKDWEENSLVQFFSTTKPMSAVIIAMLQDRGFLNLDDPITDLWPEFGVHGKDVTIAEALSHQAGVAAFINEFDPNMWSDLQATAEKIAELEPLWIPKTAAGYHPMNYGYIANELVYRILGQNIADVFHSDIANPLDIEFYIGLPEELQDRHVEFSPPRELPNMGQITPIKRAAFLTKWATPPRTGAKALSAKIPSTNGFGTALAMATLYGVFANDGFINGQEIVSKSTMADLTKSRIRGEDLVLGFEVDWAAGVMCNTIKKFGPTPETMGHAGRGGSCGFGDNIKRISFAYAPNQHSNAIVGDKRANALIDTLYSCL